MIAGYTDNQNLLELIRAGYDELQGLSLTKLQVERLWNLDRATCRALLETLEDAMFLRRTADNTYVKVGTVRVSTPSHATVRD